MITPTAEEILAAREAIDRDGSMCELNVMLGVLVASNEPLRNYCQRMAEHAPAMIGALRQSKPSHIPDAMALEVFVRGVFMGGMNYGLRIAEQRIKTLSMDERKPNA
jgi:hypothetical protein